MHTVLEKSKETLLEFYKGTAKVLWEYINGSTQQSKCKIIRLTIKYAKICCQKSNRSNTEKMTMKMFQRNNYIMDFYW